METPGVIDSRHVDVHILVFPAQERLKQKDCHEFKASQAT